MRKWKHVQNLTGKTVDWSLTHETMVYLTECIVSWQGKEGCNIVVVRYG